MRAVDEKNDFPRVTFFSSIDFAIFFVVIVVVVYLQGKKRKYRFLMLAVAKNNSRR